MERAPHTLHRFDEEMVALRGGLVEMGELAAAQVADAAKSLLRGDAALARTVIARDEAIDAAARVIDDRIVKALALRHPVAIDLRIVVAALKVALSFERIGDYAANIAKRAIVIDEIGRLGSFNGFDRMAELVLANLRAAIAALRDEDADLADRVWTADQTIDSIFNGIFRELATHMMENPRNITAATHLMFAAKNFERIGDHATNVAEMIHYVVHGENIGGERPKENDSFSVAG
jgi:phosphate transport system protein